VFQGYRTVEILSYRCILWSSSVEARQEAQELQGQVDAATQRAIDSRADNQPPTTKKAYSRPQALWKASPLAPEPLGRSQILYLSYHLP